MGQDDDLGRFRQGGQGLGRAGGGLHVLALGAEEVVEQRPAGGQVDAGALAGPENILEQREPFDAHLVAAPGDEAGEALHEQGHHLVDIDDDQRPVGSEAELGQDEGLVGGGQGRLRD